MNRSALGRALAAFDFVSLFNELGWDHLAQAQEVRVGERIYSLRPVAEKRGVQIYECAVSGNDALPDYATRQKIERQLNKLAREHLLIFTDTQRRSQVWQWVSRGIGQPAAYREITWSTDQPTEMLIDRLLGIAFRIEEEEELNLLGVTRKLTDQFDREKLTKRFYDRFKTEREDFTDFIGGLPDSGLQRWYASVLINRVMFVYFMQRAEFLDGNQHYLRHHLQASQRQGKDRYYRDFLCPLFFQGFATQERTPEVRSKFGDIPFLNGGLFNRHEIENAHGRQIEVADLAFEKLFAFFDSWDWHLDERPLQREGRDINPDVLGYIFEKYVNQKQMGAYYTKEDITEYICKNTILPFLLDATRGECKVAFEGDASVWKLLQQDPDRYLYGAVKKGLDVALPPEIAIGLDTEEPDLIARRKYWNRPVPTGLGMPTETWREFIARTQRAREVKAKLAAEEVREVNDLITLNLDIRQFVQDVVERAEGPELLRAIWRTLVGRIPGPGQSNLDFRLGLTVLDPTCGSGAFLFAALNVLEPIYEACLMRMRAFVLESDLAGGSKQKYADFRTVLDDVAQRPNERYFVYKTIIVHNLFGVDLMEEATEIAKLRLFLKLVAQLNPEDKRRIEPLPDIDFNIRAGNTLVGFARKADVQAAITHSQGGQGRLGFDDPMVEIEREADLVDRAFLRFRQQQVQLGGIVSPEDKQELRDKLAALDGRLNRYLAVEYGKNPDKPKEYGPWKISHQPFHWFVEFYGIMKKGGFDVIVGNPPYVEIAKIRDSYGILDYASTECGNLYAPMIERCSTLRASSGHLGLIVPLSLVSTERMKSARSGLNGLTQWIPSFDMRPGSIFEGVAQRLCMLLVAPPPGSVATTYTGGFRRWTSEERPTLMALTQFVPTDPSHEQVLVPKYGTSIEAPLRAKLRGQPLKVLTDNSSIPIYVHRICRYFIKCLDFVPHFRDQSGSAGKSDDYKPFHFAPKSAAVVLALLNSSLFYWHWRLLGDGFHCGYGDVYRMRFSIPAESSDRESLISLAAELSESLRNTSARKSIKTKAGAIEYQEFYPKQSKTVLDSIDAVIARSLGLSAEQLDFILNYDIKYRMGRDAQAEDLE